MDNDAVTASAAAPLPTQRSVHLIAIAAVACLLFIQSTAFEFTNWDDHLLILGNPAAQSLSWNNLATAFTQFTVNHYHPLVIVSFAVDATLGGMTPGMFHLTNMLLHALNAVLVYLLAERLTRNLRLAFAAALLFAVHPIHVEAVAWISARKDLLSTMFVLIVLLAAYRASEARTSLRLSVIVFFVMALLSKAIAVVLPFLLLVFDWMREGTLTKEHWKKQIPLFVLSAAFTVIAFYAQYSDGSVSPVQPGGLGNRMVIPFYAFWWYVSKFFMPVALSPFYPFPASIGEELPFVAWLCPLLVALAALLLWERRNRFRVPISFILFFGISIVPVLQIFLVGRAMTADRFLYLPSVGLCLLAGFGYDLLITKVVQRALHRTILATGFTLLLLSIGLTARQLPVWRSSLSLWTSAIETAPTVAESYSKRASALVEQNKLREAHRDLMMAVELNPAEPAHYLNRALSYFRLGQRDSAITDLQMAYKLNPNLPVFQGSKNTRPVVADSLKWKIPKN